MILFPIIPDCEIRDARWLFSLPAKSRTKWTGPIYRAVTELKAARKTGGKVCQPLAHIASVLAMAAAEDDGRALDVLLQACTTLEVSAKKGAGGKGEAISSLLRRQRQPELGIKNTSKCQKTLEVIEAIDSFQRQHRRVPKKAELELLLSMSRREVDRQIERLSWQKYF